MNILKLVAGLIPGIGQIIERVIPDKDLAQNLQHEIEKLLLTAERDVIAEQARVVVAEAQGESAIQRNWRPLTMLTFVGIIANNYIIVPYAVAMTGGVGAEGSVIPMLDIPPGMWSLLTVGIGGYIGGRSFEKVAKIKAGK